MLTSWKPVGIVFLPHPPPDSLRQDLSVFLEIMDVAGLADKWASVISLSVPHQRG